VALSVQLTKEVLDRLAPSLGANLQVYASNGEQRSTPAAVASVAGVDSSEFRIHGLFNDSLAKAIDSAIDEVDRAGRVPNDVVARLLIAPPYRIHALWFPGPPEHELIFVMSALRGLRGIARGQWMHADDFLSALATEDFVRGVIDDPPAQ
jgi:hypothetical protein